jgi:hypothetical protein
MELGFEKLGFVSLVDDTGTRGMGDKGTQRLRDLET